MKKVFLDANVVIDYLNTDAKDHATAKLCVQIIRAYFGKPVVSHFTLVITNFIAGKFIIDKAEHRRRMQSLFAGFEIPSFKSSAISTVFESAFVDLEDSLQYEAALSTNTKAIITNNVHDFYPSRIPVVHPSDFVKRYEQLFP